MPSNWKSIDKNFPTFTGRESAEQKIMALHNYLYQLREGLQYIFQNLTEDNFNATALKSLSQSQKNAVEEYLMQVNGLLNQISTSVDTLRGEVSDANRLSGRIGTLEEAVTAEGGLQDRVEVLEESANNEEDLQNQVALLNETVSADGGLQDRIGTLEEVVAGVMLNMDKIKRAITVQEDESVIFGALGKRIDLVGDIYINGVLYSQGETQ